MSYPDESQIHQLILLLLRNPDKFTSHERLTEDLNISIEILAQWVDSLKDQGLEVEFHPQLGCRLGGAPDLLLPELIKPQLQTVTFGKIIRYFLQVGSTNDVSHQLAQQGADEGTLVLAEDQSQGRGRLGRSWFSKRNAGIYASLILRPDLKPRDAPILNLVAAVAASEAIERSCGLKMDIKWPNDLLVNGKKCCGILAEMDADLNAIHYVILGIGINVNQSCFPKMLQGQASSLFLEGGQKYSRVKVLVEFLKSFEALYMELQSKGSHEVITRWIQNSSYALGRKVSVDLGGRQIHGTTAGLGKEGTLRVQLENGQIEEVVSGEVVAWR
jgi:BirA family biotin operon repressor/biotin-[acetyl-CoA-carboxylase] ligase